MAIQLRAREERSWTRPLRRRQQACRRRRSHQARSTCLGVRPPVVGVTSYKVYRSASVIATVAGTSHRDAGLTANTQYCYDVTASDAAGNESAHSAQTCATTAPLVDTTPPRIVSTRPANSGTDIAVDTAITIAFSEPIDTATLTQATFNLVDAAIDRCRVRELLGYDSDIRAAEILAPRKRTRPRLLPTVKDWPEIRSRPRIPGLSRRG